MNKSYSRSLRFVSLATAVTVSLLPVACAIPIKGPADVTTVEQRYPIHVAPEMRSMSIPYTSGSGMAPELNSELAAFAHEYIDKGTGAIAVSAPTSQADAQRYFADRLVSLGVPRARILIGTDPARQANQGVEISFIAYSAEAPACGDWSTSITYTSANLPSPNFGCATQHNLAAEVADPRDFLRARDLSSRDAQQSINTLDKYRKGEPTASTKTPEQSGAVSTIGK